MHLRVVMSKRHWKNPPGRPPQNQRRARVSFAEALRAAKGPAEEALNRRGKRREQKSVQAAIAASAAALEMEEEYEDFDRAGWAKRMLRWLLGLVLLPFCLVTAWTLLLQFSPHATVQQRFWLSAEFWHFAIGVLIMVGWFASGLMHKPLLRLYVLGHEYTHGVFVTCLGGKVSRFHVSTEGGFITTNKTNWVIALSPYFVPIWSLEAAVLYGLLKVFGDFSLEWDKLFYAVIGLTWTFHFVWTLWMLLRDQPDLQQNGTFLSLVVISFGNVLVLAALLCVAGPGSLWDHCRDFGTAWLRHAAIWGEAGWRWANELLAQAKHRGWF
jgi:hypothetical protein